MTSVHLIITSKSQYQFNITLDPCSHVYGAIQNVCYRNLNIEIFKI